MKTHRHEQDNAAAHDAATPTTSHPALDLQRLAGNAAAAELYEPDLSVLTSGGGRALDDSVRADMESRFGADFSNVRIHTGLQADTSARSVDAHAYTVGSDIVFSDGAYNPSSSDGRHTLAHELTHVLQQRSGPIDGTTVASGVELSSPNDHYEREASEEAVRRLLNDPGQHSSQAHTRIGTGSQPMQIQRRTRRHHSESQRITSSVEDRLAVMEARHMIEREIDLQIAARMRGLDRFGVWFQTALHELPEPYSNLAHFESIAAMFAGVIEVGLVIFLPEIEATYKGTQLLVKFAKESGAAALKDLAQEKLDEFANDETLTLKQKRDAVGNALATRAVWERQRLLEKWQREQEEQTISRIISGEQSLTEATGKPGDPAEIEYMTCVSAVSDWLAEQRVAAERHIDLTAGSTDQDLLEQPEAGNHPLAAERIKTKQAYIREAKKETGQ